MLQFKKYIMLVLVLTSWFLSSCQKEEILEPSREEAPKFFVETQKNGEPFSLYSGKNDFRAASFAQYANVIFLSICMYNAVLTNGADTFQVGLPDFKFGTSSSPSKETLDNLFSSLSKSNGNQYLNFPGVFIRLVQDGQVYSTSSDEYLQSNSYFNILSVEDYTPKGETMAMKKAQIEFKCVLENENNPSQTFEFTNGKATLLFSYKY